jgi:hypothetical protein
MITTQDTGVFSKTGAFNLLKDWIGIPKKATVNKQIFSICFKKTDLYYSSVIDESEMKAAFLDCKIRERNRDYWKAKEAGEKEKALAILNGSISLLRQKITR